MTFTCCNFCRRSFLSLRGYPELPFYPHIDSIFGFVAFAHGIVQSVFEGSCFLMQQAHFKSDNGPSKESMSKKRCEMLYQI